MTSYFWEAQFQKRCGTEKHANFFLENFYCAEEQNTFWSGNPRQTKLYKFCPTQTTLATLSTRRWMFNSPLPAVDKSEVHLEASRSWGWTCATRPWMSRATDPFRSQDGGTENQRIIPGWITTCRLVDVFFLLKEYFCTYRQEREAFET